MLYTFLPWIIFNVFILLMLAVDLFFHKKNQPVSIKGALIWSLLWISLALIFNIYIYYSRGSEDAINFLTGYLIEKMLSIDNLFIFFLIFNFFQTPSSSLHKVLFYGVLGAIIMRAIFIWLGIMLVTYFHWIIYVFGIFLIVTGIKLGFEKDKKISPEKNPILRIFRSFFPITKEYSDNNFFVLNDARYMATPLFLVLLSVETTDLIFALDSVPAVLAITFDPFIVYTSNIFAILGLRSLYFILSHIIPLFHYLHYAIAMIIVFVGIKMLFGDLFEISSLFTLGFTFVVLTISIVASILFPDYRHPHHNR